MIKKVICNVIIFIEKKECIPIFCSKYTKNPEQYDKSTIKGFDISDFKFQVMTIKNYINDNDFGQLKLTNF